MRTRHERRMSLMRWLIAVFLLSVVVLYAWMMLRVASSHAAPGGVVPAAPSPSPSPPAWPWSDDYDPMAEQQDDTETPQQNAEARTSSSGRGAWSSSDGGDPASASAKPGGGGGGGDGGARGGESQSSGLPPSISLDDFAEQSAPSATSGGADRERTAEEQAKWIMWNRPPKKVSPECESVRGVIVTLIQSDEGHVAKLIKTLTMFDTNANVGGYPVIVFHEDLAEGQMSRIAAASRAAVSFEKIVFELPDNAGDPQKWKLRPDSFWGTGYRHMIRFFGLLLYRHPALTAYDYYWRLDSDALYMCPVEFDVFKHMCTNDIHYGFNIVFPQDEPLFFRGLWELTRRHIKARGVIPRSMAKFLSDTGDYNRLHFWNNFEVGRVGFWSRDDVAAYMDDVDESGGIYKERWGDAEIHTMAVSLFLDESQVYLYHDVGYQHYFYYNGFAEEQNEKCGGVRDNPKEAPRPMFPAEDPAVSRTFLMLRQEQLRAQLSSLIHPHTASLLRKLDVPFDDQFEGELQVPQ